MKKLITSILVVFLAVTSASAQGSYVRVGVGAAVSTASSMVYSYDETGSADLEISKKNGFGNGLPLAIAYGFYFNDNVGLDIGVNYFIGFATTTTSKDDYGTFTQKVSGSMLSVVPALIVRFPLEKFAPYARLGIMVGVLNQLRGKVDIETSSSGWKATTTTNVEGKEYGGIALGAQSALGADFKLSDRLNLFAEVQMYGISYSPKKGKYTKYEVNGNDVLSTMSTREKEWEYVKELDWDENIPATSPDKDIRENNHFNNIGLIFGIKINL